MTSVSRYGLTIPNDVPLDEYLDPTPHIYAIYDYNFIGAKITKIYGHDKISALPAWRNFEFEDGGFLLEMMPPLGKSEVEFSNYKKNYESAVRTFGVEDYRIGP